MLYGDIIKWKFQIAQVEYTFRSVAQLVSNEVS